MKATELMIGDLVRITEPDRYAGAPCIIRSLMYHQEDDGAYFHVFINGGAKFGFTSKEVFSEDLEPIALSRLHLIKNGFKAIDVEDTIFVYKDNSCTIKAIFNIGVPEMLVSSSIMLQIEGADFDLCKGIESVHELQHILRLFDIEKEIVL